MSHNLKKYIKLYLESEETIDPDEQDNLLIKMEELYYKLSDDELAYLEDKQII